MQLAAVVAKILPILEIIQFIGNTSQLVPSLCLKLFWPWLYLVVVTDALNPYMKLLPLALPLNSALTLRVSM